jgi:predicted acetyltransferase
VNSPLQLRPLRLEDERSFAEACEEFRQETPAFDFALDRSRAATFADYVARLQEWSHGVNLPEGYVPASFYVGVVDGVIVGRLSLRHAFNDFLRVAGGHIGYGVRPSQRGHGYAKEMLRQSLPLAAAVGIERALVLCDVDNGASRKVIEANGGVFESIIDDPKFGAPKRRYWIETGAPR